MTILMATDLHFSDRPRDVYRFGLFDFLKKQITKYEANLVLILGDITDQKDNHSSILVNEIVKGLSELAELVPVIILKGNHDYLADPDSPFFNFLNHMKNIRFVTKPQTWITSEESKLLFLPHFESEDNWMKFRLDTRPDYAFIHQTVTGAISESGRRLDGFSLKPLKRLKCPVYGGDVHKPHTIGPVTYVGPPYHVKFGDDFIPRCLLLNEETGKTKNLHYKCPRKWSIHIREPEALLELDYLQANDQVKISLELTKEEIVDYQNLKGKITDICKELELEVFGIELKLKKQTKLVSKDQKMEVKDKNPFTILENFSKREKLSKAVSAIGKTLLQ